MKKKPAVFLDRDGTLIPDVGYLSDPAQVRLFAGTVTALKALKKAGFYLFVLTNQSGVARGYFTESQVRKTHHRLQSLLRRKGVKIDGFFYCPHHPRGKVKSLRRVCDCRKPGTGMVKQALKRYPVDLKESYMVGDKIDDLLLARNARMAKGLLVRTGNGRKSEKELKARKLPSGMVVSNIARASKWILARKEQK